jgi:hypothetical protein
MLGTIVISLVIAVVVFLIAWLLWPRWDILPSIGTGLVAGLVAFALIFWVLPKFTGAPLSTQAPAAVPTTSGLVTVTCDGKDFPLVPLLVGNYVCDVNGQPAFPPAQTQPIESTVIANCSLPTQVLPGYRFDPISCMWEVDPNNATFTVPPIAPAAPITSGPVANRLKYDETGCDLNNLTACRIAGQSEFPAIFVRRIQSSDLTLTQGIVAIQQLAAAAGVPTQDNWSTFEADPIYATFVRCPAGNCSYPTDTAFPLMGIPALADVQFSLAIVSAHSPSTPPASINTVTCPNGDCWSAPLQ